MKPQNRIQLSFILLLSNITFKFSVSNTVPKVSYLTYLVSASYLPKSFVPTFSGKADETGLAVNGEAME